MIQSDVVSVLNSVPPREAAPIPWGDIHFAPSNGAWWASCPVTGFGYRYDTLEAAFEAGSLQREDAPSPWHMLEKLRLGRSDAAVCDRRVLQDYNRGRPAAEQLHARQRVARTQTYACLSPRTAWPQDALLRALERVVAGGALKRVLGAAL